MLRPTTASAAAATHRKRTACCPACSRSARPARQKRSARQRRGTWSGQSCSPGRCTCRCTHGAHSARGCAAARERQRRQQHSLRLRPTPRCHSSAARARRSLRVPHSQPSTQPSHHTLCGCHPPAVLPAVHALAVDDPAGLVHEAAAGEVGAALVGGRGGGGRNTQGSCRAAGLLGVAGANGAAHIMRAPGRIAIAHH